MKRLLHIAFSTGKYKAILLFTLIMALGFTVSTQLEMFALGVVTRKGPDFFELFAPKKQEVTHEELETTWEKLDTSKTGVVTKEDVEQYVEKQKNRPLVDRGIAAIKKVLPIDTNVYALVVVLLFVSLFKAVTLFSYRYGTKLFSINISRDLRLKYFEHIQSLPLSFYQAHNIGALSSRVVNDAYIIADGINSALVNYFQTPFAFLSTLTLCFMISWKLSCVVFIGLPLLVGPIIFIAKRIKALSKQIQKKQEAFASVLVEFLSGVQTIKLYSMEDFSLKKYKENNDAMADLEIRSARYDISSRPVLHTIGMLFLVTALIVGLWILQLPLYEILFFCGLLSAVYEPVKKFAEENGRIQRGAAACERLYDVLDLTPSIQDEVHAMSTVPFSDHLSFSNVTFRYSEHSATIEDLSFSVKKGEMVAIVGPTGGGKSTIVSLLTRLFDPMDGVISIDGVSIRQFTQRALRDFLAVVPQRNFLFHDTIRENIRFGRGYDDAAVQKAARLAHAEEFIQALPKGYDSLLLEGGKSLSGGQQQRLAIARALIKESPVLVLDEATSSLDSLSERHIKLALRELKGQTTQIVIAHRLTTVEDADRFIVIENGRKVGDGTKEELLISCPTFARLWQLHVAKPH